MTGEARVAAADIARLAGVGRTAVSNWRRRFPDFPRPVGGTPSNPLFSMAEVEAWLRGQGKPVHLPEDERVWHRIRNAAGDADPLGLVAALAAALVAVGHRRLQQAGDAELRDALPPDLADTPLPLLRAVGELAADRGDAATVEFLCRRYAEAQPRRPQSVEPEVAPVMAELLGPCRTVLDPLCGFGPLLLAAAPRAERLLGQERDPALARLAAARLAAARAGEHDVRPGDALTRDAFRGVEADGVLCIPPFGERAWGHDELTNDPRWLHGLPPRGEPELAWVQHCLAHLRPGGHAVVLMPAAAASRRSGRRIRSRLLRTGTLRAVIALPPGAAPHSAAAPHLWVLRRPGAGDEVPPRVLLAACALDQVVPTWRSFLHEEAPTGAARAVPVVELLDDEVDLTPARHLPAPPPPPAPVADLERARAELAALGAGIAELLPTVSARTRELTMTTLGELARAGAVRLEQTPMRMRADAGDRPVLTAKDVVVGRGPTGTGTAEPGAVVARAGDIVIPVIARGVTARVVEEEVLLGPHLYLVRADPRAFDPYFLAGFLRLTAPPGSALSSRGRRVDLRRARVPRLPIADQRRYGEAFRRLEEFEAALARLSADGHGLAERIRDGIVLGELQPGP